MLSKRVQWRQENSQKTIGRFCLILHTISHNLMYYCVCVVCIAELHSDSEHFNSIMNPRDSPPGPGHTSVASSQHLNLTCLELAWFSNLTRDPQHPRGEASSRLWASAIVRYSTVQYSLLLDSSSPVLHLCCVCSWFRRLWTELITGAPCRFRTEWSASFRFRASCWRLFQFQLTNWHGSR